MATVNVKRKTPLKTAKLEQKASEVAHTNFMGGVSYDLTNPLLRLRMAASSMFFGEPMYYMEDGTSSRPNARNVRQGLSSSDLQHLRETLNATDPQDWRDFSPAELMEKAIDAALDFDPAATLQEAARLRHEENIRVTPQVILVRACNHEKVRGTELVREYAPRILARADEASTALAYQLSAYGKPVPNALKKALRAFLEKQGEYHLAKYRMENRAVKTLDVVNMVRATSEPISKLMKGELKLDERTWESIISKEGSTKDGWAKALPLLLNPKGHMALLRNLANLNKVGLLDNAALEALKAGAADGKQLPFRYYSAYLRLQQEGVPGKVLDAVEDCLMQSIGNLPKFEGRVACLCDNSGSAQNTTTSSMGTMKISTIGNLTGVLTGMAADEGWVGVFGDRLEMVPIRQKSSIFDQLDTMENAAKSIGQSTEHGIWLFLSNAIQKKEHWDHLFVYSDMQAGHGRLYGNESAYPDYLWKQGGRYIDVAKLVAEYRAKVNPKVMVYMVQIAGYQDTLVPEFYDRTFILGGWGESVLKFAHEMKTLHDAPPAPEESQQVEPAKKPARRNRP